MACGLCFRHPGPVGPDLLGGLMLVTLSMIFCLVSDPTQCQTVTPLIPDDQPLSVSNCSITAQIEGAKWVNEHPAYQMTRILCMAGKRIKSQGT